MIIFPAIDLRRGCCVRLYQGDPGQETVYSDDPVHVAMEWEKMGAKYLHLVDLDGAFAGKTANAEAVERIANEVTIPIQLGGGMRTRQAVEDAFALGVTRVIVGTMAIENAELLAELVKDYNDRIVVGIDAKDGMVAVRGWSNKSKVPVLDLVNNMEKMGIKEVIYTDINRDGTLKGPNYGAIEELARATDVSVIASGGVSCAADLLELKKLVPLGVRGVIIGKALYCGEITLAEALESVLS